MTNDIESKDNNKIGVALCGGGLQGFSHIGAIRALEELGIDINYVSGASSGSLIAGLYSIGFTPNEIEEICKKEYKNILKLKKQQLLNCFGIICFLKREKSKE